MKNAKNTKLRLLFGILCIAATSLSYHQAHALAGGIGDNIKKYYRFLKGTTLASAGGGCLFAARMCQNAGQRKAAGLLYIIGTATAGYGVKEVICGLD